MEKIDLKYMVNLLLQKKKIFIIGQIVTLLTILISVPIPLMLPALVDEVLLHKPDFFLSTINNLFGKGNAFYYIVIVTFAVIFLRFIYYALSIVITKIFTSVSKFITFKIREKLIIHLKNVCMNEYESLGSGSIAANLITDINTLDNFIMTGLSRLITSILTLIAVAIVVINIHPLLGLMIIIIQPLIMFFSRKIVKKVGTLKKEENQAISQFQDNITESLDLFGQIKASNKEDYFFKTTILKAKDIQTTSNNFNYKSVAYEKFSFTLFLISFEFLRASGLLMVAYSNLSIGMMFAMFGYIWLIISPVQDILSFQYSYSTAIAALNRINKILELKKEPSGSNTFEDTNSGIDIEVNNLNFSYNENKELLKDVSLEIKAGEKVALIGASGSGKTTLAQVIAGFYTKKSGSITYNNIQIDELDKKYLRKELFLILQMPILFNNTLHFNITMGNENISDEEIYKALEIAQLKEVVLKMKDNLDTIVGKNGIRLSGGTKTTVINS